MARIKHVFKAEEIWHVWAASEDFRENPRGIRDGGSRSADWRKAYSYSEPIAVRLEKDGLPELFLLSEHKYSVTTTKHQSDVSHALRNRQKFYIDKADAYFDVNAAQIAADWLTSYARFYNKRTRNKDADAQKMRALSAKLRRYVEICATYQWTNLPSSFTNYDRPAFNWIKQAYTGARREFNSYELRDSDDLFLLIAWGADELLTPEQGAPHPFPFASEYNAAELALNKVLRDVTVWGYCNHENIRKIRLVEFARRFGFDDVRLTRHLRPLRLLDQREAESEAAKMVEMERLYSNQLAAINEFIAYFNEKINLIDTIRFVDRLGQKIILADGKIWVAQTFEEFLLEIDKIAERLAIYNSQRVDLWRAGEAVNMNGTAKTYLRLNKDGDVYTSKGVTIARADAEKLWRVVKICKARNTEITNPPAEDLKVGHYRIDRISPAGGIKAGCHIIDPEEVENIRVLLGLE